MTGRGFLIARGSRVRRGALRSSRAMVMPRMPRSPEELAAARAGQFGQLGDNITPAYNSESKTHSHEFTAMQMNVEQVNKRGEERTLPVSPRPSTPPPPRVEESPVMTVATPPPGGSPPPLLRCGPCRHDLPQGQWEGQRGTSRGERRAARLAREGRHVPWGWSQEDGSAPHGLPPKTQNPDVTTRKTSGRTKLKDIRNMPHQGPSETPRS